MNTPLKKTQKEVKSGSKLNRSETISIRLDPKLNYLCEIAARIHKKTKSSFIEWAIGNSMKEVFTESNTGDTYGILETNLWETNEAERLARLAVGYTNLLDYEGSLIWEIVRTHNIFWTDREPNTGLPDEPIKYRGKYLRIDFLRKKWKDLKKIVLEELSEEEIEKLIEKWEDTF